MALVAILPPGIHTFDTIKSPRSPFTAFSMNHSSVSAALQGDQARYQGGSSKSDVYTLENVARPMTCKWRGCHSVLRSWAALTKHVHRAHCSEPNVIAKGGSSSRGAKTYACQFSICHSPPFGSSKELKEHVTNSHLSQLKYACPVKNCSWVFASFHAVSDHTRDSHSISLSGLPSAEAVSSSDLPQPPPLPPKAYSWEFMTPLVKPSKKAKCVIPGPSEATSSTQNLPHATWETWTDAPDDPMPEKFRATIGQPFEPDRHTYLHVKPLKGPGTELNGDAVQGVRFPEEWEANRSRREAQLQPTIGFEAFYEDFLKRPPPEVRPPTNKKRRTG